MTPLDLHAIFEQNSDLDFIFYLNPDDYSELLSFLSHFYNSHFFPTTSIKKGSVLRITNHDSELPPFLHTVL